MSATVKRATLTNRLLHYRNRYLRDSFSVLDESSTRILVNHLLTDVLGYQELSDIKTEYPVPGGFIDYLVQSNDKKRFVVEVKPIGTIFTARHLRQAIYYAAMTGTEWIVLTDGRNLDLYRMSFRKPVKVTKISSTDLKNVTPVTVRSISRLTKKSLQRNTLDTLLKN